MFIKTTLPLIKECVALAKAVCLNTALLSELDTSLWDEGAVRLKTLARLDHTTRQQVERIYAQERLLQFRKLHPKLTDEALERRIAWLGEKIFPSPQGRQDSQTSKAPETRLIPLLSWLGDIFLCEGRDGSLRVQSRFLAEWQDLVLVVPPLLILSVWMAERLPATEATDFSYSARQGPYQHIQRWLCDSSLPVDNNPFLDQLCEREGLEETHMHLNGTTEADTIWTDALARPNAVLKDFYSLNTGEGGMFTTIGNHIDRLLQQEDPALARNRARLRKRLEDAIALKAFLLEKAWEHLKGCPERTQTDQTLTKQARAEQAKAQNISRKDPKSWYGTRVRSRGEPKKIHPLTAEAMRLIDIIRFVKSSQKKTSLYAMAFLHYTLLRSQFCRLLVQQESQVGFDQFQYITLNELREANEKKYLERFRQIERDTQKPVAYLEGRFAPKDKLEKNALLLMKVMQGYFQFLNEEKDPALPLTKCNPPPQYVPTSLSDLIQHCRALEEGTSPGIPKTRRRLRLGLVAHFIKRASQGELKKFKENKRPFMCRDSGLRLSTDKNARALVATLKRYAPLSDFIRGIDAASNERHAGPEVFAPSFRRMQRAGIRRFTYHAGEDFVHLATGLRAINEAVRFLDMHEGCRIGHGTAAGLKPQKWWEANGGCVIQTHEERLDDLVFAWGMLQEHGILLERIPQIEAEIRRLGRHIWGDKCPATDILFQAWEIRFIDPLAWSTLHKSILSHATEAKTPAYIKTRTRLYGDVDPTRQKEALLYLEAEEHYPEAHEHFLRRHGYDFSTEARNRAFEPINIIQDCDVLDHDILVTLQKLTLESLHKRHIAIETLPSSNVRISIHENYEEHHAPGWLGYGREFCPTDVVIGTDDPGIFATNLRLEYAHILRSLEANGAERQARDELERLCRTAQRYRF